MFADTHTPLVGQLIPSGASLVVGVDLTGEISRWEVYDYLLTDAEITSRTALARLDGTSLGRQDSSSSGRVEPGNIATWDYVLTARLGANVAVRNESWFLDINECNYPNVAECSPGERCIDRLGSWSCIPCQSDLHLACSTPLSHVAPSCVTASCLNGGVCFEAQDGSTSCQCAPGYSGLICQLHKRVSDDSCVCMNGGVCVKEGDHTVRCQCQGGWTGRHCQVSYRPSCDMLPCFNNGTCVVISDSLTSSHYGCICPDSGVPLGTNCEVLSACDALPCHHDGTCINMDNTRYRCMCVAGFTGDTCQIRLDQSSTQRAPALQTVHSKIDYCWSVDCHNGGSCINQHDSFLCRCTRDYLGQYCSNARPTETLKYHIVLTLAMEYSSRLHYDSLFKDFLRTQIHHTFANLSGDNRIFVVINNFSQGSVIVDLTLIISRYLDTVLFGPDAVRRTVEHQLLSGSIGKYPALMDNFSCRLISEHGSSHAGYITSLALLVGILLILLSTLIPVLIWRRQVQQRHRDSIESNNVKIENILRVKVASKNQNVNTDDGGDYANLKVDRSLINQFLQETKHSSAVGNRLNKSLTNELESKTE